MGRSDYFFLDLSILFRPVHSPHEPGLQLALLARPVSPDRRKDESLADYQLRIERLSLASDQAERLRRESAEKGNELTRDLSYHLEESFPEIQFKLKGTDETGADFSSGP
jgi:hypothetical protein